jgi:hypothetical protein
MPSFLSHVFGDKELSDISTKIDNLVHSIPIPEDIPPVEGITSKFIDDVLMKDDDKKDKGGLGSTLEQDKLFENVSVPSERLARYGVYREINRSVPIIKRIIKVYTSHLLQKNPVDGRCIVYRESSKTTNEDEDKAKEAKKFAENVENHFDLPRKLKDNICPKKLLYGNCFVEVVDVRKEAEKLDLTKINLLNEVAGLEKSTSALNGNASITNVDLLIKSISRVVHEKFTNEETNLVEQEEVTSRGAVSEEKQDQDTAKKLEQGMSNPFLDVIMKVHHPQNIIILQSKYGTRLGYLEVHKDDSIDYQSVSQNISNVIGKITTLTKSNIPEQTVIDKIIYNILKRTLTKSEFKQDKIESALKSLGEDVYIFIKRLFIEQDITNKTKYNKLRTRFIPINRMVDFVVPSNDYSPYGESIVDPLILPCKLYMLAQLSNVIIKLSRAAVVRKWVIDTGSTQMHSGLIQKLKRELYNTRVSLDDLSSFKSIPKILSDFKDMFIFTKQGQRSLDVEIQNLGDPSIKVADLEDARREIIALSGIPAPYLGYMDVVELREQLVHSNVTFATEISDMQENDNEALTKLIDIIAEIKGLQYKPSKFVKVSLIPPVVLIVQLIEMTLSSIGNIAGVFTNLQLPIDPYFFLEKYVPHIDWEKFKESAQKDGIESKTRTDLGAGANPSGGAGGMY